MERIGWKDEPDESTPLDSDNLKKMEDNFETFVKDYVKKKTEEAIENVYDIIETW